jgi:anti-sigma factor RsiW
MKCPMEGREHEALLLEYAAGRLEPDAAAKVGKHLETCTVCAEVAHRQRAVWQALEDWEAAPVPLDFDRRLYQRIERPVSWWSWLLTPAVRHAVPVAAAAGVMIMAGLLLERPASRSSLPPPQESAQVEALAPEQVAAALDDMQMLREFNSLVHTDSAAPRM